MTPMHPHWHADDSDEQIVPVSVDSVAAPVETQAPRTATVRTASRKPAAIVGILLAGAFGYMAFLNAGQLPAQLTDAPAATLRLTAEGAVPASLTVTPGMTVDVINDDSIPHVLTFEKLTLNGKPLETSPIFPGSTLTMEVPATAVVGSYPYVSKTSELSGDLVIVAKDTPAVAAVSSASSVAPLQVAPVRPVAAAPAPTSLAEAIFPTGISAVLPVNTHTVGSPDQKPVEPLHSGAPFTAINQHKPVSNTNSGPATWILVFAVSAVVLLVTRKAFRSI